MAGSSFSRWLGAATAATVAACCGCATSRLYEPPLAVDIVVTGLRQDEREELKQRVCAIDGVADCLLAEGAAAPAPAATPATPAKRGAKGKKSEPTVTPAPAPPPSPEARITFSYHGELAELRYRISQLPHPGLDALRADVRLGYRGFDNKAPSIEILSPAEKSVIGEKTVKVTVKVPDIDTAAVAIGGIAGAKGMAEQYSATVENLQEGDNAIMIKATDQAGNVGEGTVTVVVDTTPPELQVEVQVLAYDKAVVKGKASGDTAKVTVDGRDVPLDLFGGFEKEVAVDPDKTTIDVVATDALGNAKKIKRSVKIASPMGDQSAK